MMTADDVRAATLSLTPQAQRDLAELVAAVCGRSGMAGQRRLRQGRQARGPFTGKIDVRDDGWEAAVHPGSMYGRVGARCAGAVGTDQLQRSVLAR